MKKIVFFLILSLFPFAVKASNDYTITSYDINIVVNENNSFYIKEDINVFFIEERRGILRKIPVINEINRENGITTYNKANISKIAVSEKYESYYDQKNKIIKIGNPDIYITGFRNYKINYLYDIGADPLKDMDELYFNIIGPEWDTIISNTTFNVEMPKDFDKDSVTFFVGRKGSLVGKNLKYEINNNIISGYYEDTLFPGEAITIRIDLEEGYFVGARENYADILTILTLIILISFMLVSAFWWNSFGKDDEVIETIEFYPPKGYNSAESEYLYKGKSTSKGVLSLLIYLANKGFLEIIEEEKKILFGKVKEFKIIKKKEYSGNNKEEEFFLSELFEKKDEVTKKDLYNQFHVVLNKIKKDIPKKENMKKIYDKKSLKKKSLLFVIIGICVFLITIRPSMEYGNFIFFIFNYLAIFVLYYSFGLIITSKSKKILILIELIVVFFLFMSLIDESFWIALSIDYVHLWTFITGSICVVIMSVFHALMEKRTEYGNEMLGKLMGFKEFLKQVEKPKLEELVKDDPVYFYNILPFTYALGVSDVWIKKFEDILIEPPRWYVGTSFDLLTFNNFLNSTMSSVSSRGSGGGSSGGGSGGGGGGSW